MTLVPDDCDVPRELRADGFRLEPLHPRHNDADHAAWSASIEHIRATPGFGDDHWPPDTMSLADNLADLERHARDFGERTGFTYTVLETPGDDVIGCVYIYPAKTPGHDAEVKSWVRSDRAHLDEPLAEAVAAWLTSSWPFTAVTYR